jgi:hypothetical protein
MLKLGDILLKITMYIVTSAVYTILHIPNTLLNLVNRRCQYCGDSWRAANHSLCTCHLDAVNSSRESDDTVISYRLSGSLQAQLLCLVYTVDALNFETTSPKGNKAYLIQFGAAGVPSCLAEQRQIQSRNKERNNMRDVIALCGRIGRRCCATPKYYVSWNSSPPDWPSGIETSSPVIENRMAIIPTVLQTARPLPLA